MASLPFNRISIRLFSDIPADCKSAGTKTALRKWDAAGTKHTVGYHIRGSYGFSRYFCIFAVTAYRKFI